MTYQLYCKNFAANEIITLGALNQANCVNYAVAATAQQPKITIGAINAAGICNVADVIMMQKYLLTVEQFTAEQAMVADLNADGRLNAVDLTLLKRILIYGLQS